MKEFEYVIKDEVGLHARPAGLLIKCVKGCQSKVLLTKGSETVDADKLMAVMRLAVKKGEKVKIQVSGDTEAADVQTLQKFFEENV